MKKLEDLSSVEDIFEGIEISPNWRYVLKHGFTELYEDNTQILNYCMVGDVCVINSGSKNNALFCKKLLKNIINLVKTHKKVILSSDVESIQRHVMRKGFVYDVEQRAYTRGI